MSVPFDAKTPETVLATRAAATLACMITNYWSDKRARVVGRKSKITTERQ